MIFATNDEIRRNSTPFYQLKRPNSIRIDDPFKKVLLPSLRLPQDTSTEQEASGSETVSWYRCWDSIRCGNHSDSENIQGTRSVSRFFLSCWEATKNLIFYETSSDSDSPWRANETAQRSSAE